MAKAFSPGGITSFFEICDRTADGKLISNEEEVGARGGGFVLEKGVHTKVTVTESKNSLIRVYINKELAPYAETTKTVANMLLGRVNEAYKIVVRHKVEIPVGAGFGSSGAGALSTALALSKALNVNLTAFQAGRIAHVAEVRCRTGLGTVGPIALGGCVITVEPGAPGIAVIDRIPTTPDHRIVTAYYRPIPTKEVLANPNTRKMVNKFGRETVNRILANPSLENFLKASKEFSEKAGFTTAITKRLMDAAEKAGAVGVAQNMVGEAVHTLTTIDDVEKIVKVLEKALPIKSILISKIDVQGARLLG